MLRVGGWLFRHRGWTPLPLLAVQLAWSERISLAAGALIVFLGEAVRLWAVGHIGARSRTRGPDVGGLVESGPFGWCRNPLYVGNGLIFVGVGLWGGPVWALAWLLFLVTQYSAIVRWEESILLREHGEAFEGYCARVPRWMPVGRRVRGGEVDWKGALRSERPTLTAIAVVTAAFWAPVVFG